MITTYLAFPNDLQETALGYLLVDIPQGISRAAGATVIPLLPISTLLEIRRVPGIREEAKRAGACSDMDGAAGREISPAVLRTSS